MNFNGGSSVKLSGIKSYNPSAKANTTFKKQFYDEINEIDYSQYEEIDYNDNIDLEKSIETVKLEEKKLEESKEKAKVELEEKTKKKEKKKKQWYETALDYTGAFIGSAVEGFLDLGEGVVDAHIYTAGKIGQAFGIDDKWAEDAIAYDVSGNLYDVYVDATGIDKDIAYGKAHSAGNFVGEMVGYYALSSVPFVGPALCCLGGAGSAVEDSINEQKENGEEINDWKVFGASALGALEGYGFGKAASGAKAGIKAVSSGGLKKAAGSFTKETIKTTIKTQGKQIAKNAAINTLKDVDTWVETGSVLADDVINGIDTGEWDFAKMAGETAVVVGENYVGNLAGEIAGEIVDSKQKSLNQIEKFSDEDITYLLQDAQTSDYYQKWSKRDLSSWTHQNFDGVFGSNQIDEVMESVNKVSDDYWPTLLKQRGLPETTRGFVDSSSKLYLPESANEHSAYHEIFHKLSEVNGNNNGLKYTDASGNLRKITGIREFYSDGFNSTWANETLTDFLASKYSDGKIYESIYSKENVKLWSRLDEAMTTAYGDEGSNLLINAYISNDTTAIRNFFDTYSKSGSYDDFVRLMQNFDTKSLDSIVSGIEKNVNKQQNSFGSILKSIFGGK